MAANEGMHEVQHGHRRKTVTDLAVRGGGQQARECVSEDRPLRVAGDQVGQPVAGLPVAPEVDEGRRVSERRVRGTRMRGGYSRILRQRLVRTSGPTQDPGQPEAGVDERGVGPHGGRKAVDGLGISTARLQEYAEAVQCPG